MSFQMAPFSSTRKMMGVVQRLPDGRYRLHIQSASEVLTRKCARYIIVRKPSEGAPNGDEVETHELDKVFNNSTSSVRSSYTPTRRYAPSPSATGFRMLAAAKGCGCSVPGGTFSSWHYFWLMCCCRCHTTSSPRT